MRFRPLDSFGLDVPVPAVSDAVPEEVGVELVALRFEVPVAAHRAYLTALEAWARASKFRCVTSRDAGTAHLRRFERDGHCLVLHLGVDETGASLALRAPGAMRRAYVAANWDAELEASTDLEVAVLEAIVDFGTESAHASRAIAHRLGLPPSALDAFDPSHDLGKTEATIVEQQLRDKSRLQLPKGSDHAALVEVDGARHYTIHSTSRLSAASLRKHYRAWASAQGYEIVTDLYDGEILELALRRRTRGLVIAWARGAAHTTVQIGPARQIFARR